MAILEKMTEGYDKPTHIMYNCNLSWGVICPYLEKMEKRLPDKETLAILRHLDGDNGCTQDGDAGV